MTVSGDDTTTQRDDAPEQRTRTLPDRGRAQFTLDWTEQRRSTLPGDRYVRVMRGDARPFTPVHEDYYLVGESAMVPRGGVVGAVARLRRMLIGRPLPTAAAGHERLTKLKALPILASDALASVAYGTEALLAVLLLGGAVAFPLVMPITIAIVVLLSVVATSYRQTIPAYPHGGGSYTVARENLGTVPGLIAAASLMVDYVLNVAVSVSAGVLALISAVPGLANYRVPLCLAFLAVVTLGNLRGIRESGNIFAVPTYFFIVAIVVVIAVGLVRILTGDAAATGVPREAVEGTQTLGLFLILRAFSNGCTALTGVEAVSNGVPAFEKPEAKNAAATLTWVAIILAVLFAGVSFLAERYGIVTRPDESVVSQIASQVFGGRGVPYYLVQSATILILILATNTSFADFPRLGSILARDTFLPNQFQFRGDRLAFVTGIATLVAASAVLLVVFGGDTNALIPLFAIGAFLAFTFSQAGMVQHWRTTPGNNTRSLIINATGATLTGITAIVIATTKFLDGAWIVLLIIPLLVVLFLAISRHYADVRRALAPVAGDDDPILDANSEQITIVPVAGINRATLHAIAFARRICPDNVVAVHITDNAAAGRTAARRVGGAGARCQSRDSGIAVPRPDRASGQLRGRDTTAALGRGTDGRGAGVRAGTLVGAGVALANGPAAQGRAPLSAGHHRD